MYWKFIVPLVVLLSALPQPAKAMERSKLLQQSRTYLHITSVSSFWNRLEEMYIAELRKDEQFQDFSVAFTEKLKKKSADGKIPLGLRLLYEQFPVIKGEAVAATTRNKDGNIIYQMAAAMTEEEYRESLQRGGWQQEATSAPIETVKSDFQGLEIIQSIENGGTPEEKSYWRTHVNGTLLISGTREWVEKNIVKLQNETIDEPTGNKLHCHLPLAPWMRDSLRKTEEAKRNENRAIWKALGFLSLKHYLLDIEIKDHELVLDGNLVFFEKGKGIFSLLDTSPGNTPDQRLIPDSITSFIATKIDFESFWTSIPVIIADLPPNIGQPLDMLLKGFQQQAGLDFGLDLIPHAGKQFTLFTIPEEDSQSIAMALEIVDAKAFASSLEILLTSPLLSGFVTVSDFRNRTFFSLKKKDGEPTDLAFCVADDHLLFGAAPRVRETLQKLDTEPSIQTAPMLQTARNLAPSKAFSFGATDHRRTTSMLQINVSDSEFNVGLGFQRNDKAIDNKEELGENEISFNYITSFLNDAYHFAEAVPDGIHHRIILKHNSTKGTK